MKIGPVSFLFVVVGGWVSVRAVMLWPEEAARYSAPRIAWQPALQARPATRTLFGLSLSKPSLSEHPNIRKEGLRRTRSERDLETIEMPNLAAFVAAKVSDPPISESPPAIRSPLPPDRQTNITFSAWSIIRGATSPTLAAGGQLGGSQAGIRVRYAVADAVHIAARISAPLGSARGKEAALAMDWKPIDAVPVTLTAERRIGLDRGGRNAFAVGAFGGFDRTLPLGVKLEGYGQAGIVGARRRDAYVDGSIRADATIAGIGSARIAAGLGAWGGAQPGVARLDVGPQIVVRAHRMRLGAEWRARIAGNARPGSGPALSLGADF